MKGRNGSLNNPNEYLVNVNGENRLLDNNSMNIIRRSKNTLEEIKGNSGRLP